MAATRRIVAGLFVFVGVFLLCFGVGNQSIAIIVAGGLVAALALGTRLTSSLRPRPRQWVLGTGRVMVVSDEPPAAGEYGRCEFQITVEAEGMPAETVVVRDPRVPVDQWPYLGQELPIEVAADNVRNVRVLWSGHLESAPPWEEESSWVDDQPDPVPRQPPGSHLDSPPPTSPAPHPPPRPAPEPDYIDFDLDNPPVGEGNRVPPDEGGPLTAPRPRPSPRPRGSAEPTGAAAVAALPAPAAVLEPEPPAAEPTPPGGAVDDLITGYPSAHPGPTAAIHGIGVTLLVTDLERSVEFYRDLLGFHEVDSGDDSAVLASSSTRLVLIAADDAAQVTQRTVHVNLEVADIEAVYAELRANGVKFTYPPKLVKRSARLELWAAAFRDPDGHGIAVTQWRTPA